MKDKDQRGYTSNGMMKFSILCEQLLKEHKYLYPMVTHTSDEGWLARIYDHYSVEVRTLLSEGQDQDLSVACLKCEKDYRRFETESTRKIELMKDPKVREALDLFGVEMPK